MRSLTLSELESSIFGHEAGAHLGAFTRHKGALETCDGGTVILHEINRMPLEVQERLAHALASSRMRPVGASYNLHFKVRIIATTSRPLAELVRNAEFSDLLHSALGPNVVRLPALRDRKIDIPALAEHFLGEVQERPKAGGQTLTEDALRLLQLYDWPGNLDQLKAAVIRAAAACDGGALTAEHFGELSANSSKVAAPLNGYDAQALLFKGDGNLRSLGEIEKDVIKLAIELYSGRMTEVARRLGIGRSTLYRKLDELGPGDDTLKG